MQGLGFNPQTDFSLRSFKASILYVKANPLKINMYNEIFYFKHYFLQS